MAVSRSREYQADRLGGMLCGNPLWLAAALAKINAAVRGGARNPAAEAMPHLFIVNPVTGRPLDSLFMTHPSTENRIAELERLAVEMGISGSASAGGLPPIIAPGTPIAGADRRPHGIRG